MAQIPDLPIEKKEWIGDEKGAIPLKQFEKLKETETLLPFPDFNRETTEEILVTEKNKFMIKEFLENQIVRRYWQIILVSATLLLLMLFL